MFHQSKPLLVLDFDETLIHASNYQIHPEYDLKAYDYFVYLRPDVEEFLNKISVHYDLGIWSTASSDYLNFIIRNTVLKKFSFRFIWDRKNCDEKYNRKETYFYFIKNLSKLAHFGYPLERTLIVDDSFEKIKYHFKNAILIKEFKFDREDKVLLKLYKYLFLIKDETNFRKIKKINFAS